MGNLAIREPAPPPFGGYRFFCYDPQTRGSAADEVGCSTPRYVCYAPFQGLWPAGPIPVRIRGSRIRRRAGPG